MNNWILLLLLALLAKSATASVNRQTYIIHMDKSKIPSPYLSASNSRQWYQSVLSSITESSSPEGEDGSSQETTSPKLFYTYQTVLLGFAAHLSPKEVQALSKIDGFLSAVPDKPMTLHTTHSSQFLGLQLGKGLWSTADVASDVIIGVIVTGVWPENPSFKDSGMPEVSSRWKGTCQPGRFFSAKNCNKKLIGARFYYEGWEAATGIKINDTIDYKSARDRNAHGTHTASTAGGSLVDHVSFYGLGNGTAAGMKYNARIAAYKACWPEACMHSDMVAAIDQAAADGVDVLSVSIGGSDDPYYADSIAIALFGATEKGVFVSCSAGNRGPISAPVENPAPWIMTVGASYTDRSFRAIVKRSPEVQSS